MIRARPHTYRFSRSSVENALGDALRHGALTRSRLDPERPELRTHA
ncbi:hypothetical protein [Pseudomonas syringae]|nr:hypothetical protein [Pseudomonas syringae]